jgi:hypothetical protein
VDLTINGYVVNPLDVTNSSYDYYIFKIYAIANPGSYWSVDTSGVSDINGPSLVVTAKLPDCPAEGFFSLTNISDSTLMVTPGKQPITLDINVPIGPVSASVSQTFTPAKSETVAANIEQCEITWDSGVSTHSPLGFSGQYSYNFMALAEIPASEAANLSVQASGNFFKPITLAIYTGHPLVTTTNEYQSPPVITIQTSPPINGALSLDGNSIATPFKGVWNEGTTNTISAASVVQTGNGTCLIFTSWSDGGGQTHQITEGTGPTNITAIYQNQTGLACGGTKSSSGNNEWFLPSVIGSVVVTVIIASIFAIRRYRNLNR